MFPTAFPVSDGLFRTTFVPWDSETNENQLVSEPSEPVLSFTSSEVDYSTSKLGNSSSSGSDDRRPLVIDEMDERKKRRMISNRESARRSRMRKQKHLENLISLMNQHKSGNRELMNRLRFTLYHGQFLGQENERLRSESAMLRQKLWDLHQVILDSQSPK